MKKGFTLIELLVVVAIIGVLAAVLVVNIAGGTESARNAQCLSNLKQLAQGVQSYARDKEHWMLAGSVERVGIDESRGIRNAVEKYDELTGWISWNSAGTYKSGPSSHRASAGWFTSAYNQDETTREYAITNGAMWKYVNHSRDVYTCPCHAKKVASSLKPNWSYVMNSAFGWDDSEGEDARSDRYFGLRFVDVQKLDKTVLFAELPWDAGSGIEVSASAGSGKENDCVLQYRDDDGGEFIGFNHTYRDERYAHVVFADGHADKIKMPKGGLNKSLAKDLTKFLCQGKDYVWNGSKYEASK